MAGETGTGGTVRVAAAHLPIRGWQFMPQKAEIDATDLQSAHAEYEVGRVRATAQVTFIFTAAQAAAISPYFTGATPTATPVSLELWTKGGTHKYTGNAHVVSIDHSQEDDQLVTVTATFRFTGQITKS